MELTPLGQKIFDLKYARTLPSGKMETWEQACARVAHYIAQAEEEEDQLQWTANFTKVMLEQTFLPGGRILANAGTRVKNMMNCFVLPIEDSRDSIYHTLKQAAEIFAHGGGIGYNFSNLRAKGSPVGGTGAVASGPLSFMELYDHTGEIIAQGSRRGAQMGILNVDHPDIKEFIQYKNHLTDQNRRIVDEYSIARQVSSAQVFGSDEAEKLEKVLANNQLTHFNISVAITDEFMAHPDTELLLLMAQNAWENGDPGVYFTDRANMDNMVPYLGSLDSTNPCGEVPLLPYEPCCLGSINLERFVEGDYIDFTYLKTVVRTSVRFLDNVHTLNETSIPEINGAALATRRLGLGVMGFADMLAEMGISYDSDDALTLAHICGKVIQTTAWETSMELADERGPFLEYHPGKINWKLIDDIELSRRPIRNVAVTSIAPTGSIALIAGVNSGIEPYFDLRYNRNITEGIGNTAKDTVEQEAKGSNIKTAHDIHWTDHVAMQAAWQDHVDNAVSKTINMKNSATVKDVTDAYRMAWELGCKGLTIYRNGSRIFQILESVE